MSRFIIHLLLILFFAESTRAQNISGVINSYAGGVAIDTCHNQLIVSSTSGFSPGMRILIVQMKGAAIDNSNSPQFGSIVSPGSAGKYEYATVAAVGPTTLTLQNKLLNHYDVAGIVQIVTVATFTDITVADTLRAQPFDGSTGGIIALEASGVVTLNADIDASGLGFRGGDFSNTGGDDSRKDYYYSRLSGDGGLKGEGISISIIDEEAGRGAPANGGGGGNARNAGGGGGASGGEGGNGGDQLDQFTQQPIGGIGGYSLLHSLLADHLFMGGGGGGGQQNDGHGSGGANGGGIIIIRAKEIRANGFTLRSNGNNAAASSGDGAGAGGAGGMIVLDVPVVTGNLGLEANGGKGGNADQGDSLSGCYGPGGGGGGGIICSSNQTPITLAGAMIQGGNPGKNINTSGACNGTSYGAGAGSDGIILPQAASIQEGSAVFAEPKIVTSSPRICRNDTVKIEAAGGDSYLWTPSAGLKDPTMAAQMVSPHSTLNYLVTITKGNCIFIDSIVVSVDTAIPPNISGNNMICEGDTTTLSADNNYSSYLWSTGETTQSIKVWQQGSYSVAAKNATGCTANSIAFDVGVYPKPVITITPSHSILTSPNDRITLVATSGFKTYRWSTTEAADSIIVSTEGTYSVIVTDINGCTATSSIDIQSAASAASADLGVPVIQAAPGDRVMIPVNIISSDNLDKSGATKFTCTLRFNRSLLVPVDQSIPSVSNGRERTLTISGTREDALTVGALTQIEFIATLGDTTATEIYLDTVSWLNGKPVQTTVSGGVFKLLGICPQGGNRLFSPDGTILLQSAKPNPASDLTTVEYQLLEEGSTKLILADMLGRNAKTIVDTYQIPGSYSATIDVSHLSNGMYTCILQTPSQIRTFRMEVFH